MKDDTEPGKDDRWHEVRAMMDAIPDVEFDGRVSDRLYWSPRQVLYAMSRYKFAARMVGRQKRVLDLGCGAGLGTWLLAVECGEARGIDLDPDAIASSQSNWADDPRISFERGDAFGLADRRWDAVVDFDGIERIRPEQADAYFATLASLLAPEGVVVVGTPNITSRQFASEATRATGPNPYSGERLEEALGRLFDHVFVFSVNDEIIHTGFWPMADYLLALACGRNA